MKLTLRSVGIPQAMCKLLTVWEVYCEAAMLYTVVYGIHLEPHSGVSQSLRLYIIFINIHGKEAEPAF
jgi:hypothetical protein